MRTLLITASLLAVATPGSLLAGEVSQSPDATAVSTVQLKKGQIVYGSNGRRIGKIFRLSAAGDAQIIIGTRLVTVPVSTISEVDGKLTTTLATRDLTS